MPNYNSKNRSKYLLQFHLILSTKYRRNILTSNFGNELKERMIVISNGARFTIDYVEVDKDHIHMLICHEPNISVSQVVRKLKSESTYWAWQNYSEYLKTVYWKSKHLWTPAYFACSIGNVSRETLAEYIKNQG
jgi:putative transposase